MFEEEKLVSVDVVKFRERNYVDLRDLENALRKLYYIDAANALYDLENQLRTRTRNILKVTVF